MKRLFSVFVLLVVLCVPAFALSDAEYLKMKKDPEFAAADRELNKAYNEAKKIMDKEEFSTFKKDQRDWIAKQRDVRAKTFMEDGYSRVEAYTKATLERTAGIRARLHIIQVCVIDDVEEIDNAYFDNGKGSYMHLSLISRAEYWFEVSFSGRGDRIELYGHFQPEDNTIALENNDDLQAVLTFQDKDTVSVSVNTAFKNTFNANAEGTYKRHYGK